MLSYFKFGCELYENNICKHRRLVVNMSLLGGYTWQNISTLNKGFTYLNAIIFVIFKVSFISFCLKITIAIQFYVIKHCYIGYDE